MRYFHNALSITNNDWTILIAILRQNPPEVYIKIINIVLQRTLADITINPSGVPPFLIASIRSLIFKRCKAHC